MTRVIPIIIVVTIAFILYLVIRAFPESNSRPVRPVKIATGAWSPFVSPHADENGPSAQIVRETIQRMGYTPNLIFSSWNTVQEKTRKSEVIGSFPWIKTPARQDEFIYSDTLLTFEYVLFYNKEENPNPLYLTPEKLQSKKYGLIRGYEPWSSLSDFVSSFDTFDTSTRAFRALLQREIDFLPEGLLPGLDILQSSAIASDISSIGYLNIDDDTLFGATESLHFIAPRTSASMDFILDFNAALNDIQQSIVYRQIQAGLCLSEARGELSQSDFVELRPPSGELGTRVFREANASTPSFVVPAGTQAAVLAWPSPFKASDSFLGSSNSNMNTPIRCSVELPTGLGTSSEESTLPTDNDAIRCKVKLLNGPERGRVVFVDPSAITLIPQPQIP